MRKLLLLCLFALFAAVPACVMEGEDELRPDDGLPPGDSEIFSSDEVEVEGPVADPKADLGDPSCNPRNACCYKGREYIKKSSSNCKYVCTFNGDLCFGQEVAICDKWDCGGTGYHYNSCNFVSCTIGSSQAP